VKTRSRLVLEILAVTIAGTLLVTSMPALAQLVAPFSVRIQGPRDQHSLRVNPNVSPNRTDIGCESERIGGTTVNGLRIVGAVAGTGPLIAGLPCTGGDANVDLRITGAGTSGVSFPNGVSAIGSSTTNFVTLSAVDHCSTFSASTAAIKTRTAAHDWAYSRTAGAAETHFFKCSIPLTALRTTASKGIRIDSFSLVYTITVVALTTHNAPTLSTVVYANNVATAVAAYGGAITYTGATATQANPYVTAASLGTPAFMNTANADMSMDFSVVMANTGVFTFRAFVINYTLAVI
jgi:hypothetical protein